MIEDDREERLRPDAPVFDIEPVSRRRGVPVVVVVALVVAVAAFVGGLVAASPSPDGVTRQAAASIAASTGEPTLAGDETTGDPASSDRAAGVPALADPTSAPAQPTMPAAAGGRGSPTPPPGSSAFVAAFDPATVLADVPGSARCEVGSALEKQAPRTRVDGPRLTFQRSWLVYCQIPAADRQAFLVDLFQAMRPVVPADTYAYGTTLDGAGNALFPYADRPMAGTVAVHADAAGRGLAIVVVIEEWRTG
jgi:hypothetical protein